MSPNRRWPNGRSTRYESGRRAPAVVVLDTVLEALDEALGVPEPERGGALVGPEGRELITHFVDDPTARVTQVSYVASPELMRRVAETEDGSILRWRGIVHSHPGHMAELSGPDLDRLADGLVSNPWLPWLHAPIVVQRRPRDQESAVTIEHGWLCWHTARLLRDGQLVIEDRRLVVLPLGADLRDLADYYGGVLAPTMTDPGTGVTGVGGRIDLPERGELLVLAGDHYPLTAPLVLWTPIGGDTMALPLRWDINEGASRLKAAIAQALLSVGSSITTHIPTCDDAPATEPSPASQAAPLTQGINPEMFGPRFDLALTADTERAGQAGWATATGDARALRDHLRAELAARGDGFIGRTLGERSVLVVGCGSVGSYAAEQLARSGIGTLVLVDPDKVEAANLSRASFEVADLGRSKVDALGRRLLNVNPSLSIECHRDGVGGLPDAVLGGLVERCDVVLAATDDPTAQLQIARHAQRLVRPALFVGLTAGARGGEIILTVPGTTPCYRCATSIRHARDTHAGLAWDTDYGTGRLRGVDALGVDIQHVTSVAVKLCLSFALRGDADAGLAAVAPSTLARGVSYLTFSMSDNYWFYPGYFGELGGQFGYQSVGLAVDFDPECTICGAEASLAILADDVTPDLGTIRERLAESGPND